MNPSKEFLLTAFERYLEQHPNQTKQQAIDMCAKYLEQEKQLTQLLERFKLLEEHAKLLESRIDEMLVDYQILRIELEIEREGRCFVSSLSNHALEQQKNLSSKSRSIKHSPIKLPDFLSSAPHKYLQS